MDFIFNPDDPAKSTLYQYTPNEAAAYTFMAFFGLATVAHFIAMIWLRNWFFIPLILGGICETFGYYGRARSSADTHNFGAFVQQAMLILAAPPFIAATVYIALARIIQNLEAQSYSMISPRVFTKIYILIDVICFISQISGVSLQATADSNLVQVGRKIILGGLIFQLVALVFFVFMAWKAQRNLTQYPVSVLERHELKWKRYFVTLYVASICILVRSLVRIIECGQGPAGSIAASEVYIYLFEASLMLSVLILFLVFHPDILLRAIRNCKETEKMVIDDHPSTFLTHSPDPSRDASSFGRVS